MFTQIKSKTTHKETKKVTDKEKRSKILNEVKPVENINKDLQGFI